MSSMPKAPVRPQTPDASASALERLLGESPDFEGAVLMNRQGAVMEAVGGPSELLLRLAPFAVGLLELVERTAEEAGQGAFGVTLIESDEGHIGPLRLQMGHGRFRRPDIN